MPDFFPYYRLLDSKFRTGFSKRCSDKILQNQLIFYSSTLVVFHIHRIGGRLTPNMGVFFEKNMSMESNLQ